MATSINRSAVYMVVGVVPALGLALLSLVLITSGNVFYISLSPLAWLGTCGLALAASNRPITTESRYRLAIAAMLIMGLLAMSPLLKILVTELPDEILIYWAILGPTLLALHYLWQVARISCSKQK